VLFTAENKSSLNGIKKNHKNPPKKISKQKKRNKQTKENLKQAIMHTNVQYTTQNNINVHCNCIVRIFPLTG